MNEASKGAPARPGPRLVAKVTTSKGALREVKAECALKITATVKADKPNG